MALIVAGYIRKLIMLLFFLRWMKEVTSWWLFRMRGFQGSDLSIVPFEVCTASTRVGKSWRYGRLAKNMGQCILLGKVDTETSKPLTMASSLNSSQ